MMAGKENEMEHTPGPWEAYADDFGWHITARANDGTQPPPYMWANDIAAIYRGAYTRPGEMEANACLIAAAPELLEACEAAWPMLELACRCQDGTIGSGPCAACRAIELARAAIAKAKETK